MKGLIPNEMFIATLIFILNGIFISNVKCEEDSTVVTDIINDMNSYIQDRDMPKFGEPIINVTIPVGREAVLSCAVDNLQTYKIAWLRVDTQTILTIQNHIITKNHRMSVVHAEKRAWVLRIKDVKESDKGWYMCQINTDPMKSQVGYLDVVVPPDILDYPTSTDMVVREGSNVTLKCAATGSPTPTITWRREGGDVFTVSGDKEVNSFNGSVFTISKVNRLHMGAYLCIAHNGIPPTVSKRVMLIVHFPPMIWIQNQLVGAAIGQKITLECQSEAYPKSINYWMKNDSILTQSERFEPLTIENAYKVIMKLTIRSIDVNDFGTYKCVAKNSLGDTDGSIKLYHIPRATAVTTQPPPTTTIDSTTVAQTKDNIIDKTIRKSFSSDEYLASTNNNIYDGGTYSNSWAADGRDKAYDHHYKDGNIPSTEVQRDRDLYKDNAITSGASTIRLTTTAQLYKTFPIKWIILNYGFFLSLFV